MANFQTNIARNDLARAWIFEDGFLRCDNNPKYVPCISFDALTQDAGDRTRIECPDPFRLGQFMEVGTIPGEISRLTTTLTSRMTRDSLSDFRRYFNQQCSLDIELVFGLCERPNIYGEYDKILVFEDVFVTSYGTDALSALSSADRAEINETIDISVGNFYEIVRLSYVTQGAGVVAAAGPLIDGAVVDDVSCGVDCNNPSDGCQYVIAIDATGLAVVTADGGNVWGISGAPLATALSVVTGVDALNGLIWVYNNTGEIVYGTPTGIFANSKSVTGLNAAGLDQDAGLTYGLVVGTAGFIGYIENPGLGFSLVPDAVTIEDLLDVEIGEFAENCDFALAGGNAGVVVFSDDGKKWSAAATAPTVDPIVAVYPKTENSWIVASDTEVFCTDDCGVTWSPVTLPCPVTVVNDIKRSAVKSVMWMTVVSNGLDVILKSTNGGVTWVEETQGGKSSTIADIPALNTIVPCLANPNNLRIVGDIAGAGSVLFGEA